MWFQICCVFSHVNFICYFHFRATVGSDSKLKCFGYSHVSSVLFGSLLASLFRFLFLLFLPVLRLVFLFLCVLHCDISLFSTSSRPSLSFLSCLNLSPPSHPFSSASSSLSVFSFHHILLSVFHSHQPSVFNLTLPCTLWFPRWKLKVLLRFPSPLLFCTVCLSFVCIFSPLQFSTSAFIFCIIGKPICSALYLNIVLDPYLCFSPGTTGAELITTSKAAIWQ